MIYVFFQYWIFAALAFVLGLFVGWATCGGTEDHKRGNWLAWAIAAFLVGLFLAGFKWIPGLLGHLLEVALLLFAAYIVGCLTGCGSRQATGGGGAEISHGHGHGADQGAQAHGHADGGAQRSSAQGISSATAESAAVASAPAALVDTAPSAATPPAVAVTSTPPAVEPAAPPPAAVEPTRPDATVGTKAPPAALVGAPVGEDSAASAAQSAGNAAEPAVAPHTGMTDGQRSILAAKEKLALQRAKVAAAAPSSAADSSESARAAAVPPAALPGQGTLAPRVGMTDGQRSIIAARQKLAEKAARAAAPTPEADASAPSSSGADEGARPASGSPPDAPSDDLKLIKGVGPKNEAALNALGVRRFADIADWSRDNEKWIGHFIKFPGRIEREHWVAQAKLLAAGIETPHAAAVKSGAVRIDDSADAPLSEAEAAQLAVGLPQQAPKVEDEHAHAGARPLGLAAPKTGKADDLKLIKGIGRQNEERLHKLGVWHFDQIAAWTSANVKWIGSYLAFPGRIDREGWIEQAVSLARGEPTEFAKRVEAGEVPTSSSGASRADKLI